MFKSGQTAFPPDLPVCSTLWEQTGGNRLHCGRDKITALALKADITLQIPYFQQFDGYFGNERPSSLLTLTGRHIWAKPSGKSQLKFTATSDQIVEHRIKSSGNGRGAGHCLLLNPAAYKEDNILSSINMIVR